MPPLLLVVPVLSTLTGGLLALRFRRSILLLAALGAGLLLGAAFLDFLPEAISMGQTIQASTPNILALTLLSFLLFFGVQNLFDRLEAKWEGSGRALGQIGGAMLIFHSFRDGMAIGLSYAASHPAGYAVAAGIAAHDIADGMNTVILTTGGKRPRRSDYWFLIADSLAPLAGGLLTIWWTLSVRNSILLLAVAAGFFIQMATSDFLPQVRRQKSPSRYALPAVLCGAAMIYVANLLVAHW
ncbi:MAG TPA: ZIP family metal transporter [Acidobacteriaceae bacterium]